MEGKNVWRNYDFQTQEQCDAFADKYMEFLGACKTERECVSYFEKAAKQAGYQDLNELISEGRNLKAGDKVYRTYMNKMMLLFHIGKQPMANGMNILGAHIDSPRIDVKQNPVYEDSDIAYLDTHYYGGIKAYQYVAMPLALHGVIVKKNNESIAVNVGENENDPVFFISDLLPHLAREQMTKKASEVIEGEALDLIIGNKLVIITKETITDDKNTESCDQKEEEPSVSKAILQILKEKYDISEEDFLSAELEIVPAGKAKSAGFDRSMILAYGQDDRVCAFPAFEAILNAKTPERTSCVQLVDKEEIGSTGATGVHSRVFENTVAEVMNLCGGYSDLNCRRCLEKSKMLSADVSAAFDPSYAGCFEKKNAAFMGRGMVLNKYLGSGGKGGSNDANAEYIAYLRNLFDKGNVKFQTAEIGKVNAGGGGTIAGMLAAFGMDVIDCGVAVMNMHAPWEATSKADVYELLQGYKIFLADA